VIVALSGGADSLALLGAALPECRRLELGVAAVIVDHGLQAGSDEVAARVAAVAAGLGADPVRVVRVDVGSSGGPEAAARDARYAALDAAARELGAAAVLLGHTRDDQAETVLLGLARGSGARSLSGMSTEVHRGGVLYLRPFLDVSRASTRAACDELGLDPWEDPHNTDPTFRRVRVRTELLPALDDVLGHGVTAALARSADLLRDDADALDAWAEREWAGARPPTASSHAGTHQAVGGEVQLEVAAVVDLPAAVRRRVLRLAALAAGVPAGSLTAEHLARLDALVARWHGQGELALPGPVSAGRSCGRLTFRGR
jgi:tRNA(Ile)-lysidine synthase